LGILRFFSFYSLRWLRKRIVQLKNLDKKSHN
jgi:hypothetical protein